MIRQHLWQFISATLACTLIFSLIFAFRPEQDTGLHVQYEVSDEVFGNPLMGYAPRAGYDEISEDVHLLYVDITWREWEPEKGVYDIAGVTENNQLDRWRAEGKHIVLRFVCDIPDDDRHMDIPDWLYAEMNGQGTWYDISYGQGFAPDYSNALMIEYHKQAVEALGEAFGRDGFVAYIQLGSLGHWGEWHVKYQDGIQRLPEESIREEYIRPWIAAFPHARILMRRPFNAAARYDFGLYNDMTGDTDETLRWLEWIDEGGEFSQTEEENALSAMPGFWTHAPVGGEFTSSTSMEELLKHRLDRTLDLLSRSHVTFLGPKTAKKDWPDGYDAVLGSIGYRIAVTHASLVPASEGTELTLTWENTGAAPMYHDWPVQVYVCDADGNVLETVRSRISAAALVPGTTVCETLTLETENLVQNSRTAYTVCVGIVDPMTGLNAVRLAMDVPQLNGASVLFAP